MYFDDILSGDGQLLRQGRQSFESEWGYTGITFPYPGHGLIRSLDLWLHCVK